MNAIYICTSTFLWQEIATQLKENFGFEPKLYVGFEKEQPKSPENPFFGIPYYNVNDARSGIPLKNAPAFEACISVL